MSAYAGNRSPVTTEPLTGDQANRSPVSNRRRRTEEDTSGRKKTTGGTVAADAAPTPPAEHTDPPKPPRRAPRGQKPITTVPDAIELTGQHLAYAAEYGFADPKRVRAITDAFLSHHRFKGTKGRDWYAGWQGWIRRQREMDDERASRGGQRVLPARNGTHRPSASLPVDPALAAYDEG